MDNLNKINGDKDLYDRMCAWMADMDDVEAGTPSKEPYAVRAAALAEEAFTLFYDIYQTCNEESQDDIEGVPV
tara:strand:- start:95 stop:313 length:219 start_codon:yes stop_codon:yes gene_type:complete